MSVAVQADDRAVLKVGSVWQKTSEEIIPLIDTALNEAGLSPHDLDAIVISEGPGSFTALRIGFSTAKGLCFALEKPLVAVGTLDAIAASVAHDVESETIVSLIYSKADEFYVGIASRNTLIYQAFTTDEPSVKKTYQTISELEERFGKGIDAVVVGRVVERWRDVLNEKFHWKDATQFSAQTLLGLGKEKLRRKRFTALETAEPFYIKQFEAKTSERKFFG